LEEAKVNMLHDREDSSNDAELDPRLQRAVDLLRVEPAVRREWRASLLHRTQGIRIRRQWQRRLPIGLAAAVCIGLASRAVVLRSFAPEGAVHAETGGEGAIGATVTPAGASFRFTVRVPHAARVSLVGDFDQWNPVALPMTRLPDGSTWIVNVRLAPGRHAFAFSVDGGLRTDPSAPRAADDDFGTPSSVVVVPGIGEGS
jgi:hypothetical protein